MLNVQGRKIDVTRTILAAYDCYSDEGVAEKTARGTYARPPHSISIFPTNQCFPAAIQSAACAPERLNKLPFAGRSAAVSSIASKTNRRTESLEY